MRATRKSGAAKMVAINKKTRKEKSEKQEQNKNKKRKRVLSLHSYYTQKKLRTSCAFSRIAQSKRYTQVHVRKRQKME